MMINTVFPLHYTLHTIYFLHFTLIVLQQLVHKSNHNSIHCKYTEQHQAQKHLCCVYLPLISVFGCFSTFAFCYAAHVFIGLCFVYLHAFSLVAVVMQSGPPYLLLYNRSFSLSINLKIFSII